MAIPDYLTITLPLLKLSDDGKEHSLREAIDKLADQFRLTEGERRETIPSGKQELFANRVSWARTYLKKAGLLKTTRWGYTCITNRGTDLLKQNPKKIDKDLLYNYPEFKEFLAYKGDKKAATTEPKEYNQRTPKEELYHASQTITDELAKDILQQLMSTSPQRFENIVVELLVKMGYGGSYKDAAQAIGRVGDEGVDGVINEDRLGLDRIYLQAKRWQNKQVGHPDIRDFVGALDFKHADRGIFITTSDFTNNARESVIRSSKRIILIDGNQLAKLMISFNVGVTTEDVYELKKLDMDYFIEE